jgi:hypothetical protein
VAGERPPILISVNIHIVETTVDEMGRIVLDHVPFVPGEKVDVVLRSHSDHRPEDLSGSVIRFENPFDPASGPVSSVPSTYSITR